mgnify:CR=1 FL=1
MCIRDRIAIRLAGGYGEMEQPLPTIAPFAPADAVLAALGLEIPGLPVLAYTNGPTHVMVMLAGPDPGPVAALAPDLRALERLGEIGVSCFALTAPGQVRTRMFAPGLGVPEDPATGSAAGPLAVHLVRHGRVASGQRIEIHQGQEIGRPSLLYAEAHGSSEHVERVLVGGNAVEVARGEYRLQ